MHDDHAELAANPGIDPNLRSSLKRVSVVHHCVSQASWSPTSEYSPGSTSFLAAEALVITDMHVTSPLHVSSMDSPSVSYACMPSTLPAGPS